MARGRTSVRIAVYCTHPGCGEQAPAHAKRSRASGEFVIDAPPGWTPMREEDSDARAPYEVPSLCPVHASDLHAFIVRSIEEVSTHVKTMTGAQGRTLRTRIARCAHAVDMWTASPPTPDKIAAMASVVTDLRATVGLPPGAVSALRRKVT